MSTLPVGLGGTGLATLGTSLQVLRVNSAGTGLEFATSSGGGGGSTNTILTTSGAPAAGTGANGDYAYDPAAKTMYGPKASGAWPAGVVLSGTPGTPGTNGNTLRTTSGAPTGGNDGDYAIDLTAQLIYGPKASGAWPAGVNIKGNTGAVGRSIQVFTALPSGSFGTNYFAGDLVLL